MENIINGNYKLFSKSNIKNRDNKSIIVLKSDVIRDNNSIEVRYIIEGENNEYYGEIVLKHSIDDTDNTAEIEYYSSPEEKYRRKGNILIGLQEVLKDAFVNYQLDNIYLNITPKNVASQNLAIKSGFIKREGSRRYFDLSKEKYLKRKEESDLGEEIYVLVDYNPEKGEFFVEKKFVGLAGIKEASEKYNEVKRNALSEFGKIIERKADGSQNLVEDYSNLLEADKPLSK